MTAYIAAPFTFADYVKKLVPVFESAGITIVNHWQDREDPTPDEVVAHDTDELYAADTLIFLAVGESTGGGCFTEFGMAKALNYRLILIGDFDEARSPFLTMADERYPDVETFLEVAKI
jgi:hypothetical protein